MDIQEEIELYKKYRGSKLNNFGLQLSDFKNLDEYLGCITWLNAKAQAVPEPSINMTGHDLKYIWDFMDYADPENLDTEVTIQLCKEGFDGAGLYAWVAEYPEEGGIKLGEAQEPDND